VPSPDECEPRKYRLGDNSNSVAQALDVRVIPSTTEEGVIMLWARVRDVDEVSAGTLGLLSDHVAFGFSEVLDGIVGIVTLAATVRVASSAHSSWTLLQTRIEATGDSLGFGTADIWSEDGVFLGSTAQTLALVRPA
jgi:acyl-CoA thioesterase